MINQNGGSVDLALLEPLLSAVPPQEMNWINLLQQVQDIYGYAPPEALSEISERCQVPLARLTGIISFYAQFRLQPPGKYQILICNGTACHVNNAEKIAEAVAKAVGVMAGKVSADGLFCWQKVACLGCCSLAPAMMINDRVYGKLTPQSVAAIIDELRQKEKETATEIVAEGSGA